MNACPTCGKKKVMKIPEMYTNAGEELWRCPQHHFFRLDGEPVPEPGSKAWRERGAAASEPKPKAAAKKAAKKKK